MELVEVSRLVRSPDGRTAVVAHSETTLTRGLDLGEAVVLRAGGEYRAAKVRNIEFGPDDTVYTLELGTRLPEELARQRLEGVSEEQDPLHEVVDLLGDLRHDHPGDHPDEQPPTSDRVERQLEHA